MAIVGPAVIENGELYHDSCDYDDANSETECYLMGEDLNNGFGISEVMDEMEEQNEVELARENIFNDDVYSKMKMKTNQKRLGKGWGGVKTCLKP